MSLLDDTWHHVCFTWESFGGNLSLYIDGLLIGQKQSVHPGLTFNSTGSLVIGQLQKAIGGEFHLNESFLGEVADTNVWKNELTQGVIEKQSDVCYGQGGDLIDWPVFSNGSLQFHREPDSIPSECSGLGEYQSINQSIYQPVGQSLSQFVSKPINGKNERSILRWPDPSIN